MAEWTDEYDRVLKVVERVLRYDLERLKRTPEIKRVELYNEIAGNLERFSHSCYELFHLRIRLSVNIFRCSGLFLEPFPLTTFIRAVVPLNPFLQP